MRVLQTKPYMLNNEEGQFLQSLGALVTIMATTEQTGGTFNLFAVSLPPGFTTPLIIHYAEDVAVYVLEGELTIFWGDEGKEALAGSYLFHPRGTPHGFHVQGTRSAQILVLTIPAGLDCFVIEQARQAHRSDTEREAARYKIEVLGPLPV